MSKVYQSVKGVVQESLQRRKPHLMVSTKAEGHGGSLTLDDAIEELEKIFVDGIGKLKAAISDDKAVVASQAQRAEQVIEGLKANIAVLEARLRETEDAVQKKDAASQKVEESLNSEICDLQSVVRKKEEALESRDSEVSDLKSKIGVFMEQVAQSGLALQHAKTEAATEAQRAEQVIEGLKANITVLAARVRETEDSVHKKEAAAQKMEESLSREIRDLQISLKKKEEALESRDSEVSDLKSKTDSLVEHVTQLELAMQQAKGEAVSEAQRAEQVIESLKTKIATLQAQLRQTEQVVDGSASTIKGLDQNRNRHSIALNGELASQTSELQDTKAEALLDVQPQGTGPLVGGEELKKTGEEKPITFDFQAVGVTSTPIEAPSETVSQDTFERVIVGFSELANVIESIAALIVRDHARVFGESMEEFPKRRFPELLESLSREMADDKLRTEFCERFAKV
jgi:DNA repair exonuclease SbcCD ATPase subunit